MRIVVIGAGGTGGYFGGLLARAGEDVSFLARGTQLEALRTHGLTVKSRLTGTFSLPVHATSAFEEIDSGYSRVTRSVSGSMCVEMASEPLPKIFTVSILR